MGYSWRQGDLRSQEPHLPARYGSGFQGRDHWTGLRLRQSQRLAHVHATDYYELFGLPREFQIDRNLLPQRYLGISRNIHPDRFAQVGQEMQTFALRMSAAINKAHDVLRDDFLRAEYLLESSGG